MHPLISLLEYVYHGSGIPDTQFVDAHQIDWIIETGLGPLFQYAISNSPSSLSSDISEKLLSSELSWQFVADARHEALTEIIKSSGTLRAPITLLKGMSLSSQYYPVPYTRMMRDIDILVAPEDLEDAEKILMELGYRQKSNRPADWYIDHHHSMPFYNTKNDTWVEIHTKLFGERFPQARIAAFSPQNVQNESVSSEFDGFEVRHLTPELQLAYLPTHWAESFQPLGGMIVFVDILYLLRGAHENINWEKLRTWLPDPLLSASVYLCFSYLQKYQICDLEEKFLGYIAKTHPSLPGIRRALFQRIVDAFYLRRMPFNRVLTPNTLPLLWDSLVYPSTTPVIPHILWSISFPPGNPDRYKLSYQWERLNSIFHR